MRALDPDVVDVIWRAVAPLIPRREVTHPLGCHRQRASDRACFAVMLVRLATGCSWEDAERLCGNEVSDTTVRTRRDEWITSGVFEAIATEAINGDDPPLQFIHVRKHHLEESRERLRRDLHALTVLRAD